MAYRHSGKSHLGAGGVLYLLHRVRFFMKYVEMINSFL